MKSFLLLLFVVPLVAVAQALPPAVAPPVVSPRPLLEPMIAISPDNFYPFDEVLYLEGRSQGGAFVDVLIERQGEKPLRFTVKADSSGEWVGAEKAYLSAGIWEVRARQTVGDEVSGWSNPRIIRSVVTGVTFLGLKVRYVVIASILAVFILVIASILFYFLRRIRRMREDLLQKQVHDTEDRFRKGFSEIRKDLMDELKLLTSNAQSRPPTPEELDRMDHILRELDELEQSLGQDVGNIKSKL